MADKRFFDNTGEKTLSEILEVSGAHSDDTSANTAAKFADVASLSEADKSQISFLDNAKYKDQLKDTKAGAVFVSKEMLSLVPEGVIALISQNPYKSYALTAQAFYPKEAPKASHISERAIIAKSAKIGDDVCIEAGAVIGDNSWVEANAVIGRAVEIGQGCRIGANTTISHTIMGDYVRIYTGACIGQDGFGFAIDPSGHVKVPQLGRVIIGTHCEIGANTTIDRGAGPDTTIGDGAWIDNLVQIGHNVKIGRGCVIVAQVGISGSSQIGDYTVVAGQAGITGHLKIGSGVQIAAQSGVMRDIPDGETYMGSPAKPIKENMKQVAFLNKAVRK